MDKYADIDSTELMEILQSELLKRVGDKRIPNNSKGLDLLEKEASQVCKGILTPYVSENVSAIAESKGEHKVHINWIIPEPEGCIDKD